jgi:hypothetical protein
MMIIIKHDLYSLESGVLLTKNVPKEENESNYRNY